MFMPRTNTWYIGKNINQPNERHTIVRLLLLIRYERHFSVDHDIRVWVVL